MAVTFAKEQMRHRTGGLTAEAFRSGFGQVYYVRVGNLIKIGWSGRVEGRLRHLPPDAELLAVEDGGRQREIERHRQFRHLLAGRQEWFHAGEDLIEHIACLA